MHVRAIIIDGRKCCTNKSRPLEEKKNHQLTTDNKIMKRKVVDLEADIISGSSANLQQNMQQQREQQVVVEDLGKRIEELAEMVQNLYLKNESLATQNAILSKELSDVRDSSAMVLEKARNQNKQDLAKFLRASEASVVASAAAAAKIAGLEEEILSLQNAFSERNSDAAVREEMKRFLLTQKERGDRA